MRLITADNAITTLGLFAACLAFAEFMTGVAKGTMFELPTFVWALAGGVILRNVLESILKSIFLTVRLMCLVMHLYRYIWRWRCCHSNSGNWPIWLAR